ncbi:uncharacterized protein LOC123591901 [Leopardus geoffroyi]|uniref:uncharacterized protein LOC123591901 n=1 Tax=Leopardus geoffroyi TaxID=46844 RepID=UPI001E25E43C|nr:uncharacterized protein LOC123591901 [Leopardus geoffroyi]
MKCGDNPYEEECNYNERAAQGKSQELGGKTGAQSGHTLVRGGGGLGGGTSPAGPHRAGRPRAGPRPRLQPHCGAGSRTPLAAPRTGPPRAALYFRGGALATEDAAAGAATASGVTFSRPLPRPPPAARSAEILEEPVLHPREPRSLQDPGMSRKEEKQFYVPALIHSSCLGKGTSDLLHDNFSPEKSPSLRGGRDFKFLVHGT